MEIMPHAPLALKMQRMVVMLLLSASPSVPEKRPEPIFDSFEYFQDKEDDLHKSYNDRSYLSSEDLTRDDSRTGSFLPDLGGWGAMGLGWGRRAGDVLQA